MFARDVLLLAVEAGLYFAVLATLFRLRKRLGIGLFVTALGTMHFLETYLAASLYVPLPGGMSISPGSSILFSGKLVLLLLVYIKEDAAFVRQPIYGLLVGNFLTVALVVLLREHSLVAATPGKSPDIEFLKDTGWLMVWGTLLLFVDAIAIILVYERLGRWLQGRLVRRIWLSAALVLTFDQIGFFAALHFLVGVPFGALIGGWIAKVSAAGFFAILTVLYLRFVEREGVPDAAKRRLRDVFDILTYRERYHALLEESGRDALTGALDRRRLDTHGRQVIDLLLASRQTVSVLVIDLDRFKEVNDRFGHPVGDEALKALAQTIRSQLRPGDYLFRYGGDEFVICCVGVGAADAALLAARIAASIRLVAVPGMIGQLAVSIGVATGPDEGTRFDALFALADERLYVAKRRSGRPPSPRRAPAGQIEVISVARRAA